eukprot:2143720-Rhodomonas_salina.3
MAKYRAITNIPVLTGRMGLTLVCSGPVLTWRTGLHQCAAGNVDCAADNANFALVFTLPPPLPSLLPPSLLPSLPPSSLSLSLSLTLTHSLTSLLLSSVKIERVITQNQTQSTTFPVPKAIDSAADGWSRTQQLATLHHFDRFDHCRGVPLQSPRAVKPEAARSNAFCPLSSTLWTSTVAFPFDFAE